MARPGLLVAALALACALAVLNLRRAAAPPPGAAACPERAAAAAPPPAWALPPGPAALAGARLPALLLAGASEAHLELALNWAASAAAARAPFLLAALDAPALAAAAAAGLPYVCLAGDAAAGAAGGAAESAAALEARAAAAGLDARYLRIRAAKAALVALARRLLLEAAAATVLVCDADVALLASPLPYLAARPAPDFFVSTDCGSVAAEAAWEGGGEEPRCGARPGRSHGFAYNSGIWAARATPAALALLAAWEAALATGPLVDARGWTVDDQLALHDLLEAGSLPAREVEGAPRTLWAMNRTLRVHPLPALLFAGGHVAFVQRLPERYGVEPIAVHATFQPHGLPGKVVRLREFGLWRRDAPEYFAGRFLAVDSGVRAHVARAAAAHAAAHAGARMPDLQRHLLAMEWQLAARRDALALANATGRVLVLPQLWCWCDQDQAPAVLERCAAPGTDLQLPFACPADGLFDPGWWEARGVEYRLPGFLESAGFAAGPAARGARAVVDLAAEARGGAGAYEAFIIAAAAAAARLGAGAAVTELRGFAPGAFRGFGAPAADAAFDAWHTEAAGEPAWCCAGAGGPHAAVPYALPRALAGGGGGPWRAEAGGRPAWCDEALGEEDAEYAALANHPCSFLPPPGGGAFHH